MVKELRAFVPLLLEMAQPDLYRRNAFRVLNLNTRASAADIKRQFRRMELERNFGVASDASQKTPTELLLSPPLDAEMFAEAKSRLEDVERRFIDEFFASWDERGTQTEGQISSEHDGAVLFHALALNIELSSDKLSPDVFTESLKEQRDGYWRKAIYLWQRTLDDVQVWDHLRLRVEEIGDPRLTKETIRQMRENLPLALSMISARLAVQASQRNETEESRRHVKIMQKIAFDAEVAAEALRRVTEPLCQSINDLCKTVNREAKNAPGRADQSVEYLLARARPLLLAIDDLLPKNNAQRAGAFDAVASTANDAIILKTDTLTQAAPPEWEAIQRQFERLARYAATPSLRAVISQNIEWGKNNVQRSVLAICFFCSKREAQAKSGVNVTLYQWQRENLYHYYDVPVPRCPDCEIVHDYTDKLGQEGAFTGMLVGILITGILFAIFWGQLQTFIWTGNTLHLGAVAFLVIGIISLISATSFLGKTVVSKKSQLKLSKDMKLSEDIKPLEHRMNFPTVVELERQGWSLNKPSN